MKKNFKKISLLSSSLLIGAPIVALISCGDDPIEKSFEKPNISNAKPIKFDSVDLSGIKAAASKAGIQKADIESINIEDLQKYRISDSSIDKDKKETLDKMEKVLLNYAFVNNKNKKQMEEIQKWINNSSLAIYNSQSAGRGPWRSKVSEGTSSYYRNDLVDLKNVSEFKGYDLVGSKFVAGSGFNAKRFINDFNKTANPNKGDRIFDNSFSIGNSFGSTRSSATSFSIYRGEASGKYEYNIDKDGKKNWTSSEETKNKLFDGIDISLNNQSPAKRSLKSAVDLAKTINNNKTKIIISTKNNKNVNYSKAKDGSIIDSNVKFKAKDLFYAFIRGFYASKDFRNTGMLDGVDLSSFLLPFDQQDKEKWLNLFENQSAADAFDNNNLYLLDLYGVDVLETIKSNINNLNDDQFIIEFKNFAPTSLEMFKNNSLFTPFAKSLLDSGKVNLNQKNSKFSAKKLSIFSYGNPYSGMGKVSVDNILSVAPFLYTKYSTSEGENIVIKQNPNYIDQSWVNDKLSIKGYSTEMTTSGVDASAFAQSRLAQFKDAKNTQEYILDLAVRNFSSLLEKVSKYKVFKKPLRSGLAPVYYLNWNFYGFGDDSFNSLGKKMIWGDDSNIKTNPSSISTFFSGGGAKVRASINSSINWYAMAQTLLPGQNKEFYPGIAFEDEFNHSNSDESLAAPSYLSSTSNLKNIYERNMQDRYKAWTPDTLANAAKTLDQIATNAGATKDNPAKIGIFKYIFTGQAATPAVKQTNKLILERLNTLTPKVQFGNQKDYSWSDFISHGNVNNDAATILFSFGVDYSGLGSINQQYLTNYGTFAIIGLFRDAFGIASS